MARIVLSVPVRSVLLVVDLEGVAGVDDIASLVAIGPGYAAARRLLTDEVAAVVRGLTRRGVERIAILDSHRSGSREPNVIASELAGIEVRRDDDCAELVAGYDAVACLGMHAGAGSEGFAAHTIDVHTSWRAGERDLSETDIIFALAAERGVPALFVSGDDVLASHTPGVTFVVTKTSASRASACSQAPAACRAALEEAAAQAAPCIGSPLPGRLTLRFKSRWQAELAEAAGGERTASHDVAVVGATFTEAHRRGRAIAAACDPPLAAALRVRDPAALIDDITRALLRPLPRDALAARDEAMSALGWYLEATRGDEPWRRVDRALVLHMLEGHAPRLFADAVLAQPLADAVRALAGLDTGFTPGLDPMTAMARLDSIYVQRERSIEAPVDAQALADYIRRLAPAQPLFAWLMSELAAQIGVPRPVTFPPRPLRMRSRLADLYWLTHEFLLDTRYLRRALPRRGWESRVEELCLAVPELVQQQRVDVVGEIALCLQLAGEHATAEHAEIVDFLRRHQEPGGRTVDPPTLSALDAERRQAHTTAVALLVFAGTAG
jgi:D-amino peptidase